MKAETVAISKDEDLHLKKQEKLDHDLIRQLSGSFEDLKNKKFKRVA